MGPKKQRDIVDENTWRRVIEEAPLDEEHWTVKVIIIEAAGSDQDRIYLNKFETFAAEEKRFVIKNICKTETVFMVNQLGSDKKVKDENHRVFEEGNSYLRDKKDIPPDIFALIIKYLILKMKEEYLFIKRQRLHVKEGMRRESATMINKAEVRGTVTGVTTPATALPSPSVPPATPEPELPEDKKFNTLLRERGEEWRDKVYVDDYPVDGPNIYVALTGFVEPFLPGCLVKIGIPLTGVIQIRIDPGAKPVPPTLNRSTKRGQSQTEILTSQSMKFWDILQQLRIQKDSAVYFKNTAFVVYSPPYWQSDDLSGDPDKIYDEICYLMYDIQDLSRQHLHYLDNMDIIEIPEEESDRHYQKYYHTLIDNIPLECINTYLVLDSILNTASRDKEFDDVSSRTLSTGAVLNPATSLADKFKRSEYVTEQVFNTLCKTDVDRKKYRLTYGEEYETQKDPKVIQYGDFATYNTFHLGNLNLDQIVHTSLLGMPVHNLWFGQERPTGELEAKANFHVNVLLSCFDRQDVETSELNRLLHILACRKLYNNRSSLKKSHLEPTTITQFKKVYLKRSVLAEPLPKVSTPNSSKEEGMNSFPVLTKSPGSSVGCERSDSYCVDDDPETQRIKFLFECPDISELVSAAEIVNNQPIKHMIDDYDSFEDFSGISAFQIMCEAFNKFNCVDYKYCEVTDCFVLMFFNSHDHDGIARNEWRCHLSTPLCLQDFFDYILEENYYWIKKEENLYEENLLTKAKSESKDFIDPSALKSCVEDTEVDRDLLMEGSLKQQEIAAAEAAKNEEDDEEALKSVSSKKNTISPEKSSRKTKSPTNSSAKTTRKSLEVPLTDSDGSVEALPKPFLGYDLGDRRVEVFGKEATYFSKDGTKVSTVYSLIIPMNLEYIILNVIPGNSYNEFWVHKALGEFVKPEIIDICESFRITTKDQVMINIKKQKYQVPIPLQSTSMLGNNDHKVSLNKLSEKDVIDQDELETKTLYSLFITWPNGLITETVHENNSSAISHIKQYNVSQITPVPDEEMRCISLNGEVIIFKTSGDIEVLRPDASVINITKCYKKIVIPETLDVRSEDNLEKSKKGKDKTKDKTSKTSTKSSKSPSTDDEKIVEENNYEYELVVEEFDIINNNGVKQHYINETPISSEKLFTHTATNYCVGEEFSKRMDGTTILFNTNGVHVVTFPNKTRIITNYVIDDQEIFPEWTDEEKDYLGLYGSGIEVVTSKFSVSELGYSESSDSKKIEEEESVEKARTDGYVSINLVYTIEHSNFSTITINKLTDKIYIDSPNETRVKVNQDNHYKFILDSVTTADFDGEQLNISYEACPQCKAFTECTIKIAPTDDSEATLDPNWVNVKDSHCRKVIVDDEGGIFVSDVNNTDAICSEEIPILVDNEDAGAAVPEQESTNNKSNVNMDDKSEGKSESSVMSHGKCKELYLAKNIRFFILKRDLTCSELVHRTLIDQYQSACRWQPWCSINNYESFGDHRRMVSILTPVHLTETEKWLMNSTLADKPKFLTYKDLKKESVKGYYHWMRPYERFMPKPIKPDCVLPPRQPRAFILRILERQWSEQEKEELKGGKELLAAILRYRHVMESDSETLLNIPIYDPRSVEERRIEEIIQSIAHKVYQNLKEGLLEDVEKRATATITTEPEPSQPEMYVEGEMFEEELSIETKSAEEHEDSQKLIGQAEQMSENLKKYWRRRAEELKKEEFYKYLLREGVVPPYFRNVLGGAIWWEMNNTAGEAVEKSERRKIRCICAESSNTSGTDAFGKSLSGPFM